MAFDLGFFPIGKARARGPHMKIQCKVPPRPINKDEMIRVGSKFVVLTFADLYLQLQIYSHVFLIPLTLNS